MKSDAHFWDKLAPKYRQQKISNVDAYEATLDRVLYHMPAQARVLELGCGTGGTALRLAPEVHSIVATDFSPGMIAQAEARQGVPNVTFMTADVFDARLEPGVFDVVLGFNLFHLVPDAGAAFARIHDLLPDGGLFVSKTPCIGEPSLGFKFGLIRALVPLMQRVGKAPFVRYFKTQELVAEIAAAGFEVLETGNYPDRPPSHLVVARKL
ncbi:MAG: class I SAM-dependent methyltransferase [Pseudomonadota bacterium]